MGSENLVPVSQIANIVLGGTPKRENPEYWGGIIKWASAKDVTSTNTRYIFDTEESITELGLNESNTKLLPKDTIVITARGTVGAMVMLGEPMCFNQTCYGLTAKEGVDQTFLFFALKASIANIHSVSYGTVFNTITMKSFDSIKIPLPSLEEQKRIAEFLGTLDDKIELNRQMNRTLEVMARAIFKSWFVYFDPVYAKMEGRDYPLPNEVMDLFPNELVESELGLIPNGWEVKPLDKLAKYINGYAMQKYPPKEGEDSLPVIKIRELRAGSTDDNSNNASLDIPKKYIILDGDVLFSWSGSLLVTLWTGGKGALNQHPFKVSSKKFPKWFYYLWTIHHLQEFQRIAAGKATTMGHIKRSHLSQALTVVPERKAMKEFDKIFEPIIDKIISNSLESQTLEKIRDTLLPRLMSGEIEV